MQCWCDIILNVVISLYCFVVVGCRRDCVQNWKVYDYKLLLQAVYSTLPLYYSYWNIIMILPQVSFHNMFHTPPLQVFPISFPSIPFHIHISSMRIMYFFLEYSYSYMIVILIEFSIPSTNILLCNIPIINLPGNIHLTFSVTSLRRTIVFQMKMYGFSIHKSHRSHIVMEVFRCLLGVCFCDIPTLSTAWSNLSPLSLCDRPISFHRDLSLLW